jgi:hypothetical protein
LSQPNVVSASGFFSSHAPSFGFKLLTLFFLAFLLHPSILLGAACNALEQGGAKVTAGRGRHGADASQQRDDPVLVTLKPVLVFIRLVKAVPIPARSFGSGSAG